MNRATNAAVMRAWNRTLILNLLRLGPISRVELAEKAHLTRASVTQIIAELIDAGLVEELNTIESASIGRRRTLLAIKHGARYVIGVNLNRKCCSIGIADLYGDVVIEEDIQINGLSVEAAIEKMSEVISAQRAGMGDMADKIIGVGVCSPGPVDYIEGRIIKPPMFSAWNGVEICRRLSELTGLPAMLEKDTNARALEEKYFGPVKNAANFILVHISEGVGSGMVVSDMLYRGARGMGTELGHTSIYYDGPLCACGNRGCLENYLRIPVLLDGTGYSDWYDLASHAGEGKADAIIDRAASYLASPLTNVINMCDLEMVVLAGDIESCPGPLVDRLNALLSNMVMTRNDSSGSIAIAGCKSSPVRTASMAFLYDFFQQRGHM